jgi:hypothetical protein
MGTIPAVLLLATSAAMWKAQLAAINRFVCADPCFLRCLLCVSCTDNLQRSEFVDTPFMREGWVYVDGNDAAGHSVVVSSSSTG